MNETNNETNEKVGAPETRDCSYELGQAIEVEWCNIDTKQSEWRPATFSLSHPASDRPWRAIITTANGRRIREVAPECIRKALTAEGNAPRVDQYEKAQHSPLPWHVNDLNPYDVYANGRRISDCRPANCICYTAEDTANAAFIVQACNAFPELQAEEDRLHAIIEKDTMRIVDLEAHAQRLADALGKLCDVLDRNEILIPPDALRVLSEAHVEFAQWEGREQ